jgi:hypothetical protein
MSNRHQTASEPPKSDRRIEHHRERQATRTALHTPDLEEMLDPPSVHNVAGAHSDRPPETKHPRFRYWKQPPWKRGPKGSRDRTEITDRLIEE